VKGQLLGERTCLDMPDDTVLSCSKMAEPIDLPFGLWTWVGRRKQSFGGVPCRTACEINWVTAMSDTLAVEEQ